MLTYFQNKKYSNIKGNKQLKNELFHKKIETSFKENIKFCDAVKDVKNNPNNEPLYFSNKSSFALFRPKMCKGAQKFLALIFIRDKKEYAFDKKGNFNFKLFKNSFLDSLPPEDSAFAEELIDTYFSDIKITEIKEKKIIELAAKNCDYYYSFELENLVNFFTVCASATSETLIENGHSFFAKSNVECVKTIKKSETLKGMHSTSVYLLPNDRILHVTTKTPIKILNTITGKCEKTLAGTAHLTSPNLIFLSSGDRFVCLEEGALKVIKIWNTVTGEYKTITIEQEKLLSDVVPLPGDRLAIIKFNGRIEIWNADSGICENIYTDPSGRFSMPSVLPDGRILITCRENVSDVLLKVWNINSGESAKIFAQYQASEFFKPFIFSKNRVAAVTSEGIKIWSLDTDECLKVLTLDTYWLKFVALFHLPNERLISAASDGQIKVWNLDTGESEKTFNHSSSITSNSTLKILPDGRLLIAESNGSMIIWDTDTGKSNTIRTGPYCINYDYAKPLLVLSSEYFARASYSDGSIRIWNINTGDCEKIFSGHPSEMGIVLSMDQPELLDYELHLLSNGRFLSNISGNISDNKFLDGSIKIWNRESFITRLK